MVTAFQYCTGPVRACQLRWDAPRAHRSLGAYRIPLETGLPTGTSWAYPFQQVLLPDYCKNKTTLSVTGPLMEGVRSHELEGWPGRVCWDEVRRNFGKNFSNRNRWCDVHHHPLDADLGVVPRRAII